MQVLTLARCSVSLAAVAMWPGAAMAQAGPDPAPQPASPPVTEVASADDIVVTGLRESLQSIRNIRRNSLQIIDAVVAEDIGKLPDLNTAQTAARIPGVQVYRQGGEAQNVLVRGLPNFTTTYNGREIFTAETRIVALQDFPSANVAALEVFKTSSAELVEPGLAGLVNIRSRQPLDFQDGQFAGSVWGLYTRQGRTLSPNFNLLATRKWDVGDGGEFGVLLNVSRTEMRYLDAEISNTDFLQTFRQENGVLVADAGAGTAARFPDIQRLFYRSGDRVRPSVNGAIQYKPNPDIEFYAEGLWQGFRNGIDDRLLAAELFNGAQAAGLTFRDGTNVVSGGTVNALPGSLFSFQGATYNRTDTYQFAGGTRLTFDRLQVNIDIARTESTFTGSTESVDRRWTGGPTIRFDTETPRFDISGINLLDPSEQYFDGLFEESQKSTGDDWQFRGDLEYTVDSPLIRSVQLGLRYTDRNAERRITGRFSRPETRINATALPVDFAVFNGVDFGGTVRWAAPTYDSVRDNLAALRLLAGFPSGDPVDAALLYTADEQNLAGYGQLNLGGDDLDGTVGLRVTRVKTRVAGPQPTGVDEIDGGSTDTAVLPNASIRWRAAEDIQFRAAVSKTRTLPTYADLQPPGLNFGAPPPGGIGTDSNPWRASGGNPFLNPFTSWNFDLAAEYYFAASGFVSLTGFHRAVDGFIQQNSFRVTDPTLGVIEITGPVNTGKGRITGVELQGQAFADFESLPDWVKGFGLQANITYLDAKTQQDNGQGGLSYQPITDQLNGVSKWNYNLVGIYERYGLSARLSWNDRSSFRATQQFRGDDIYREFAQPAGRLDLSLSYAFTDRFSVFGDWTNITEEPFRQDFSSARNGAPNADFIRYIRYDESTLSLGVRFNFGL
jgi:iron complex outermembrane recepter protein